MCGNTLLPVTQKICVPYFLPMTKTYRMYNNYYGGCKAYATSTSPWENLYDKGVIDTSTIK